MSYYGTLDESKTYHAERGNIAWGDADDAELLVALIRAADFIDNGFRSSFPGEKTGLRMQYREWPRSWAYDVEYQDIPSDEIPIEVKHAGYEAGLFELLNPGLLQPSLAAPGRQIKSASVDGAVAVEYTGPTGIHAITPTVSKVGGILARVLTGGSGGGGLAGMTTRVR